MEKTPTATALDEATEAYRGDPVPVPLQRTPPVPIKELCDATAEFRALGWTVQYESDPPRLVVS